MKKNRSIPTIESVNWVDPELLHQFEFGFIRKGDRTALIGLLDLSCFPTVVEYQELLEDGYNPTLCKPVRAPKKGMLQRLWRDLSRKLP